MLNFMPKEYQSRGYWSRLAKVWPYGTDRPEWLFINTKLWIK